MKKARAPKGPSRFVFRVGLIFVALEGYRAEKAIAQALVETWADVGDLRVKTMRMESDRPGLEGAIKIWSDREKLQVIGTCGGSGHRPGDFVPEVTAGLLDRSLPGIEERMYLSSPRRPEDMLFRGRAGIRKTTLIINLPARPARVRQILRFMAPVLRHLLEKMAGDESECAR